jgi:hypothetical protein
MLQNWWIKNHIFLEAKQKAKITLHTALNSGGVKSNRAGGYRESERTTRYMQSHEIHI